jgi:hypothetical protein
VNYYASTKSQQSKEQQNRGEQQYLAWDNMTQKKIDAQ